MAVHKQWQNRIVQNSIAKQGPYPRAHQLGLGNNPIRKFLFIGPEAPKFAFGPLAGRAQRWLSIMNSFVLKSLEKEGFNVGEVVVDPKSIPVRG